MPVFYTDFLLYEMKLDLNGIGKLLDGVFLLVQAVMSSTKPATENFLSTPSSSMELFTQPQNSPSKSSELLGGECSNVYRGDSLEPLQDTFSTAFVVDVLPFYHSRSVTPNESLRRRISHK